MGYAYDGYPAGAAPPWFVRIVARLFKRRFLRGPMMAGIRIPRVEGGTFGVEDLSTEEGAARLRTAMERLEKEAPPLPSPVLGHLTHEQWIRFNLAHAELHLGFFGAEDDAGNTG